VQNTLNLNRESTNDSDLDTLNTVVFTVAVAVAAITMNAILRIGLIALFLPFLNILDLSSYFIIKNS
jgi:hypothetical protein